MKEKWGVTASQFVVIFIVFGLTGTTTAVLTRYVTNWLGMDATTFWLWKLLLRLGMLLIGYQAILLTYGALLGQWAFFWKYEKKILKKLGIWKGESDPGITNASNNTFPKPQTRQFRHVAIFASGAGSNAEKIISHLQTHPFIKVSLIVCNKKGAGVINIADRNGIPVLMIEKEPFFRGDVYISQLKQYGIDFIVLAGFLWKIPETLIRAYPKQIINIHPALLPKYGGKGMYGQYVHEAVIAAGEKESGITIHYVNEHFDEGEIIFQAKCLVDDHETAASLAQKIHVLEHQYFPGIVQKILEQ